MSDQQEETFEDILDQIKYGELPPDEESEEATPAEPAAEDETKESTSDPDNSDEEPEDDDESEPAKDPEPEPESGEGEEAESPAEDKTDESEEEEEDATLIDLDGEKVTLDQIREWRKDGLRQADYTRKTQEIASRRQQLEDRDKLVAEIVADPVMEQFVAAHPKALQALLSDPENTRALLGNNEEIQALWDDYEMISSNPRLAERFGKPDTSEADIALKQQRYAENVQAIANALDQTVDAYAARFSGVDADDVKDYVLQLGGMPTGDNVDPAEVGRAFERLFGLFFVQEGESLRVDDRLIQARFEELQKYAEAAEATSAASADEHNKAVDEALKDKSPPATPAGKSPGPTPPDELEDAEDLNEVIHGLLGYND